VIRLDAPPANAIDLAGGRKIFAAGADIKAMATWGPDEVRPSVEALGDACDLLEAIDTVSIAAVNGYALGGGMELALACDLRYLAEDATVGQPEITIGVIPGAGGTQRLVRLVGPGRARELVYTGRFVPAGEALALGLAERVVPPDEVLPAAVADARSFARGPRRALAAAKAAVRAAVETPGEAGVRAERAAFLGLFGTPDQREGMAAFLEKRDPRFGG
jgi:enoyl-CoA hydratase/carnithine racemase